MNPFLYLLCLEEHGADYIHELVGQEMSGKTSNSINLDSSGRPHNPMINSGSILMSSLYKPEKPGVERHKEWSKHVKICKIAKKVQWGPL